MFDIKYTATWDGNYLSVVAVVLVDGDDRLRSSQVIKPTPCKSVASVQRLLFKQGFVAEEISHRDPFTVEKITPNV